MTTKLFLSVFFGFMLCLGGFSVASAEEESSNPFACDDGGCGADGGLQSLWDFLPGMGLIQSDSIIDVTMGWVRLGLTILGIIAFIAFLWAGALYILAFINEENAESAKKILIWTAIGIIIILMSYALTSLFINATAG